MSRSRYEYGSPDWQADQEVEMDALDAKRDELEEVAIKRIRFEIESTALKADAASVDEYGEAAIDALGWMRNVQFVKALDAAIRMATGFAATPSEIGEALRKAVDAAIDVEASGRVRDEDVDAALDEEFA